MAITKVRFLRVSWGCESAQLTVVARKGAPPSAYRAQKPRHGCPMAGFCCVCDLADGRAWVVASRADEYRHRAQQCLEMAGTFRDREARAALSHMAEVWLRPADNSQDAKGVRPVV
jgi:hypothetical protein